MSDVDNLTEVLAELSVETERPALVVKTDVEDDGYNSKEDEGEEEEEEEEVELEPLKLPVKTEVQETIQLISRGPISLDQESHRYSPYARDHRQNPMTSGDYSGDIGAASCCLPTPNVLILRKLDTTNPSKLDVPVSWTNKYEICIERYRLPEETYYGKGEGGENKVQLFIQLNPSLCELKSFLADVRCEAGKDGKTKSHFIGPIVISLKTELEDSQERKLLELTTMEERTAAFNLVNQKDIFQLTSGIGPHKDTVLSVLCAQRNPANPGQTYAQIHAVVQRLVNHADSNVQQTVFKQNNNTISAFEIAAITNNSVVACYLAEVMYNLSPDTRSAIRTLNCRDTQGNTIIHLLARKGDSNQRTLRALLDMKLTDGTKIFSIISNSKRQFPLHIATQNIKNQPETIKILHGAMPRCLELVDDDGMSALHYACQRSTDVNLVRTILSYKKDNINICNRDGLTAVDLVVARTQVTAQTKGMFAIELIQQEEIVTLLRNNGGVTSLELAQTRSSVEQSQFYSPPLSISPQGSPYSYQTSPRTESLDSHSLGSVSSYQQTFSPDSVNLGSQSPQYQGSPYNYPDSPGQQSELSYEDQIATQILTEFPEITNVLGQILDESNH